jgi:hypothetical protein
VLLAMPNHPDPGASLREHSIRRDKSPLLVSTLDMTRGDFAREAW